MQSDTPTGIAELVKRLETLADEINRGVSGFCFDGDAAAEAANALEAAERERDELKAHGLNALRLAHEMQDKAVAAERERCEPPLTCPIIDVFIAEHNPPPEVVWVLAEIRDINSQLRFGLWHEKARAEAAEAKLARLEIPDEALVEAVMATRCGIEIDERARPFVIRCLCRAIANTLTEGK